MRLYMACAACSLLLGACTGPAGRPGETGPAGDSGPEGEHGPAGQDSPFSILADDLDGADLGAKINAADQRLGTSAGEIHVLAPGVISTEVTISASHTLKFGPGAFEQSAAIVLSGDRAALRGTRGSTILTNTTAGVPSVAVGASLSFIEVSGLTLTRSVAAIEGGTGIDFRGSVSASRVQDVIVNKHYDGIILRETDWSEVESSLSSLNVRHGILFTPTAGYPGCTSYPCGRTLQWSLLHVFAGANGMHGFFIWAPANNFLTLGTFVDIATYGNGGNALRVQGESGVAINGVRLERAFFGGDTGSEIYLDTNAGMHQLSNVFLESSVTGHGIEVTASNTYVELNGLQIYNMALSGISTAAQSLSITNFSLLNNGLAGHEPAAQLQSGIYVDGGRQRIVGGRSAGHKYGIYINHTSSGLVVANDLAGNTVEAIKFGDAAADSATVRSANTY